MEEKINKNATQNLADDSANNEDSQYATQMEPADQIFGAEQEG